MKKRVNITIEQAVLKAATEYAHTHYEVGTLSHMVTMALLAYMEKASRKARK